MIIYLPCKLGEKFTVRKFIDWQDGKRIYEDAGEAILRGFDAFDCQTKSLSIPNMHTTAGFLEYDHTGEFPQQYIPKYKISVDVKSQYKLSDIGFPGKRTVRLSGLKIDNGSVMAEFVTSDRYEHLFYPIRDIIHYARMDDDVIETQIEFCKVKENNEQITMFDLLHR